MFSINVFNCTVVYDFSAVDVPSYCMVHKDAVLPDLGNCGKFFNCSDYGGAHVECLYPDLYSPVLQRCTNFTSVTCDSRPEPQAPCKYTDVLFICEMFCFCNSIIQKICVARIVKHMRITAVLTLKEPECV